MTGFALYRLPREQQVTLVAQTEGEPMELPSLDALNGRSGFVVAPFSITPSEPLLLIRPDLVRAFQEPEEAKCAIYDSKVSHLRFKSVPFRNVKWHTYDERAAYTEDFGRFHRCLEEGSFRKIVLSRCSEVLRTADVEPLDLFCKACSLYPRMFISLVSTAKSGLWLTATPEILLEGRDDAWRTIALAGTMKLQDDDLKGEGENVRWSTKNIQEQRYVATYLKECLEQIADNIREEGPRTVRAANLVHLRSDFTFTLLNNARVGDVLQMLHPTPAVCGLPKQETYHFIAENEHTPRLYYSGFMGPLNLKLQTSLYVSLRCMQITADNYRMYAGGGLLKDSVEEQEWQETEAKLETMRQCIATRKM